MSGVPLSLTRDKVTGDSTDYSHREEVLAELELKHVIFPPTQMQKRYKVAQQKGVVEYIVRIRLKDKKNKFGRRS